MPAAEATGRVAAIHYVFFAHLVGGRCKLSALCLAL
jgi:hypothetical protein